MSNLSITPSKLEIQISPGANYVQSYVIKNNSDQQVILNSSIESWIPQGSDGNVAYTNTNSDINFSLSNSDLKLGQNFIIGPNQSKQLVLKIQVTPELTSGDRYLTFFVNQSTNTSLSSNSTQLIKLGSHLLITVTKSEIPVTKLIINNFKTNTKFIDCFFSPLKFTGQVLNQSDYFDKIDKSITISKNDNEITKISIFPDNVLAHHSRNIRCLSNNLPVDCQLEKPLWPGFYQATIDKQTIGFVVMPYSIIIIFILFTVLAKVLIDIYKYRKL